ncbi:MAG TPA: hypothetical protein VMV46_13785 [Thermoanaerobaculia bacterium]|nr:hypothetical protein [Thermoanaerobaculia bacterium]
MTSTAVAHSVNDKKTRSIPWLVEWYGVSVDSARLLGGVLLTVVALAAGYFGFQRWNAVQLERQAYEWVSRPEALLQQLRGETGDLANRAELDRVGEQLEQARDALDRRAFRSAISLGQASYDRLEALRDRRRLGSSIAWFLSVQGDVQYRRGESGDFLRAYARTELHEGDYVRSAGSSSAEIHFRAEETVFTLRPSSLIKLTRDLASGGSTLGYMEYGWVAVDTSRTPSGVETPYTTLQAGEHSLVSIAVPEGSTRSTVRVSEGTARVRNLRTGESRELGERQEVSQSEDRFGVTVALPPPPDLLGPGDDFAINIDSTDRVKLTWSPVAGAVRYALQVSRSRLFGQNVVDAGDRVGTSATLGLREEGRYLWRVAAYGRGGGLGPWSEIRKFRVVSYRNLALEEDTEPPPIEIEVLLTGNIALITGSTEPGARIEINGEAAAVAADGSFTATRTLFGRGRVPIEFVAVDRAGNRTTERRFVYLDEG